MIFSLSLFPTIGTEKLSGDYEFRVTGTFSHLIMYFLSYPHLLIYLSQLIYFCLLGHRIIYSVLQGRCSLMMTNIFLHLIFSDPGVLEQLVRDVRELKVNHSHKGISTAAKWVASLRDAGTLTRQAVNLDAFLRDQAVKWWPTANVAAFPSAGAMESATCQPYVSARINDIVSCRGRVHKRRSLLGLSRYLTHATEEVRFRSIPVDGHSIVSFSGRSPDVPCYNGDLRGACSITLLGDVKGCGPRNKDFPDAEVGHILDMATDLLTKEQFTRTLLYCFLTDGYRFQFFCCRRIQRRETFTYEQSPVYGGEVAWQVR